MTIHRAQIISTYRRLLREASRHSRQTNNPMLKSFLIRSFQDGMRIQDPSQIQLRSKDAQDVLCFLEGNRLHKINILFWFILFCPLLQELLESYFPPLTEESRIQKTANRVGLQLPKMFDDGEDDDKSSQS
ncbi:hypothetical protein BKA69DRAFT_175154 [Paraphysoderma sedebokerense]|nr:hypothetical protein BKA69DRAFT_175154 [Paraphysoderma sedebokerense]